jgi:DNA-binding PadR family transcriptional regulator
MRRRGRGDVRAAVIVLLEEGPRNGYQLIQEIEDRSGGAWRPSPGSIYPILSQLQDEGLVSVTETEAGRTVSLTETGRSFVAENRESLGQPWAAAFAGMSEPRRTLMRGTRQMLVAIRQIGENGTEAQFQQANEILVDARRKLYRILAEEEPAS